MSPIKYIITLFFVFSINDSLKAEPWLSNRFAQNCAACHSPSRRNLPAKKRRCTLSCQGCHVNPNGGGLRNEYGKWNQNRWLRSYRTYKEIDKAPAPLSAQHYRNQPNKLTKKQRVKLKKYIKAGSKLVYSKKTNPNEKLYDRSDRQEFVYAQSRSEFMYRLTKDDPYRQKKRTYYNIGGDVRFFYLKQAGDNLNPTKEKSFWPMGLDLAIQVRPVKKYNYVSFVYEGRFLNSYGGSIGDLFKEEFATRSLYVMVDNLPYASFVMAGQYRPMFNHYTADHENLVQVLTGLTHRTKYQAITVGGSPNVPFFNLHAISPASKTAKEQDTGYVVNLGGRFVTYGGSVRLSYWSTKAPNDFGLDVKKTMTALTFGAAHKRFSAIADYVSVEKEFLPGAADSGAATTFEVRYRFYRENYFKYINSSTNTYRTLKVGDMLESSVGITSFIIPNLELDLTVTSRRFREENNIHNRNMAYLQLHGYF